MDQSNDLLKTKTKEDDKKEDEKEDEKEDGKRDYSVECIKYTG